MYSRKGRENCDDDMEGVSKSRAKHVKKENVSGNEFYP